MYHGGDETVGDIWPESTGYELMYSRITASGACRRDRRRR